ncbi:TIGR02584 family CRISPR-associated protein [Neiella marina]|uniref:TIGR02584 family CRISPR-associated protein n=1 Tax=Neiella holothuriorum TaxID=2870530 RepID=A0ABS7ED90_9GAMM|nr:CRISPR-associated ring nuclease Csm6 [Neiella holothuriorum]MBW8190308.1 TIGR02584 family CRISPR-associated protein [Neiella holothuriorum]
MKQILLSTIGASPQVLTETLYAIAHSGRPFPHEIFVISTLSCRDALLNGLVRDGHLAALIEEYQLPNIEFDESNIWLIEDAQGRPLEDAKSVEDQSHMADFITQKVYELTRDNNCAIHASLAGGRKTMAFYFGYAMSMFGRAQDTLSHVFVNDDYEFVRDFWYPTKQPKWVTGKHGHGELDVSRATITLAEIPFVRMSSAIDETLADSMANQSFSQTVGMLNASTQNSFTVSIDACARLISTLGVDIKLTAKEIAFYLWLLEKGEKGLLVDRYFSDDPQFSLEFLGWYAHFASDPRVFGSLGITPEDYRANELASLTGMDKEFLQPICSTVNRKLRKSLPGQVAVKLEITSVTEDFAQRYRIQQKDLRVEVLNCTSNRGAKVLDNGSI